MQNSYTETCQKTQAEKQNRFFVYMDAYMACLFSLYAGIYTVCVFLCAHESTRESSLILYSESSLLCSQQS